MESGFRFRTPFDGQISLTVAEKDVSDLANILEHIAATNLASPFKETCGSRLIDGPCCSMIILSKEMRRGSNPVLKLKRREWLRSCWRLLGLVTQGMLFELLDENPLVLATFAIGSRETLLHIASMFGHVDFIATLIIKLHPSSALELNQDGYSPMHISSTQGHRETVEFFIEFGRFHSILNEFCLQKNIHGRIPLHCAVSKGRVGVMGALLIACPESVQQLTDERETVLHLAVRNNQREAFSFLIQQPSIKALVNFMDDEGNTILHLATVCRQHQVSASKVVL
ncbi:hypothetical protein IFM89_025829 [Coptis chinensis]|uniref:Uncharacterized protein n=1 Tax=Coptis chinensis TaxID=261450 RepID=A0A835HE67_9MAGN|nr:hypothetical protein IFM89_025829 [Coptis chinensis]